MMHTSWVILAFLKANIVGQNYFYTYPDLVMCRSAMGSSVDVLWQRSDIASSMEYKTEMDHIELKFSV